MKAVKVYYRSKNFACVDYKGRDFYPLEDNYGNTESILEQVSGELAPFGLRLVLGMGEDMYAFRVEETGKGLIGTLRTRIEEVNNFPER